LPAGVIPLTNFDGNFLCSPRDPAQLLLTAADT
jgi:hypothetical protein